MSTRRLHPVVISRLLSKVLETCHSERSEGFASLAVSDKQTLRGVYPERSRRAQHDTSRGFTLVELVAAMGIMTILAGAALPLARVHSQHLREMELRSDLREIRTAIDRYKDFADQGLITVEPDTYGFPPDLETLVNGVSVKGNSDLKYKFLRRIPVDPMTGKAEWGKRSMQDDPESTSWGGENVFDVYSLSQGAALDGTRYADW